MHLVIIFYNIGGYHAARLRAAHTACQQQGWDFTAVQVTDKTKEHPWGDVDNQITFPLKTLLPVATTASSIDRSLSSSVAAYLLPLLLDTIKPDFLAIPGWGFPVSRAALSWCKRHKIPTILMSESKWDDEKRLWWKEQIKSWLYVKKFDAALVGGKVHRDYLIKLGFPSEWIFFGYDVVDNDYFSKQARFARQNPITVRNRQPGIPNRPYFLAATRFIQRKNVLRLIEAYTAYHQQVGAVQAWDLVICGSGEQEASIRKLIVEKNLKNCVHLPGFITYEAIGDWYGLANAFVHPALTEQWGLVVNEACAAGLPVVGSRTVGACYELVEEGKNGFLFTPENTQDITSRLLAIHQLDPQSLIVMGRESKNIVANYAPSRFADGIVKAAYAASNVKNSLKKEPLNVNN